MLEDINDHRSGVAQIGEVGGEPLILGYDFLGINDWMLLTLVTADLLGESTTPYLIRYVAIIAFLLLLMIAMELSVIWYYRRILEHIQAIALTDPLTGGYNNLAFRMKCEELLREHPEKTYAIVYLNIRNFKWFNECFGINQGDELLRQIYRNLGDDLQDGERLIRNSGDHFYLFLECSDEETVCQRLHGMLERLDRNLSENFSFDQVRFAQGAYLIQSSSPF